MESTAYLQHKVVKMEQTEADTVIMEDSKSASNTNPNYSVYGSISNSSFELTKHMETHTGGKP